MGNAAELKPKLLIVEDDFENQKLLHFFLKRYFRVDICDSSDSFLNCLIRKRLTLF